MIAPRDVVIAYLCDCGVCLDCYQRTVRARTRRLARGILAHALLVTRWGHR